MPERRIPWERLFRLAEAQRKSAYAPYSKFQVGAAVYCADGTLIGGANVENASYGLSLCAERLALLRCAVEHRTPLAIALVVKSREPTPPCGACRQVAVEFMAFDAEVRSRTLKGTEARWTVGALLPSAFTPGHL